MSRIAKNPVSIPKGVDARLAGGVLSVKGPKGQLQYNLHPLVRMSLEGESATFEAMDGTTLSNAMSGTTRALVNNMVTGVSKGFEKKLTIVGVGYRAAVQGRNLNLSLGFSHPVVYSIPDGITVETPSQTEVVVRGADKQLVGQVAAEIRRYRSPEPYKGKGVRYSNEHVVRKEAKKK